MRARRQSPGWVGILCLCLSGIGARATAPYRGALDFSGYLRDELGIHKIKTYNQSKAGEQGLDVVVISAGFTKNEEEKFDAVCEGVARKLLSHEPWKRFSGLVNVHGIFIADESRTNTLIGVQGGILSCDNHKAMRYAGYAAEPDAVIVVNNSLHGNPANGYWGVQVTSILGANHNSGALVHEFGHGLAGLGDTYVHNPDPYPHMDDPRSLWGARNVCGYKYPCQSKWHYWSQDVWPGVLSLHDKRPSGQDVTNEEGAGWATGIYRPVVDCLMRGTSQHFCRVCNETMQADFFRYIELIQESFPVMQEVILWSGESMDFEVKANGLIRTPPEWLQSRLAFYRDGKQIAMSERGVVRVRVDAGKTEPGVHHLGANLTLQNDEVRRDFGNMSASRGWLVTVMPYGRPILKVKKRVRLRADEGIDLPVRVKHETPAKVQVRMSYAPPGAVLEGGRFRWHPEGKTGSWKVDFTASVDGQVGATKSMMIDVTPVTKGDQDVVFGPHDTLDILSGETVSGVVDLFVPDRGHLLFELVEAPGGFVLDRYNRTFTWTPERRQAGPNRVRMRVRNGGNSEFLDLHFRVARKERGTPIYDHETKDRELAHLQNVQAGPSLYRRLFETLRMMRLRDETISQAALAAARPLYAELPAELHDTFFQDLAMHAWAFVDRGEALAWMRDIATGSKSGFALALVRELSRIDRVNELREIEWTNRTDHMSALIKELMACKDPVIRATLTRTLAGLCRRAGDSDKALCVAAVLCEFDGASFENRLVLLRILVVAEAPQAIDLLFDICADQDKMTVKRVFDYVLTIDPRFNVQALVEMAIREPNPIKRGVLLAQINDLCADIRSVEDIQNSIAKGLVGSKGPGVKDIVPLIRLVRTPIALDALKVLFASTDLEVAGYARMLDDYFRNEIGASDGYIADWQISGRYEIEGADREQFEASFPLETVDPMAWTPYRAGKKGGVYAVNLQEALGGTDCVAYMKAVIQSDRARDVRFLVGSDDGIKIWLNGKEIHSHKSARPLRPGEDTFTAHLKSGPNAILCKVTQGKGMWAACVQLLAAGGRAPLKGVRVMPPEESSICGE